MGHRTSQEYGENLYCSWSSNPKAKCAGSKPVDSWYSEMTKYTFGSEPTSSASGHFTQVLWKITNRLVTGLDSTKTMCPHRCKATKIFPFYTCMCIDFLWKKNKIKENPFCRNS